MMKSSIKMLLLKCFQHVHFFCNNRILKCSITFHLINILPKGMDHIIVYFYFENIVSILAYFVKYARCADGSHIPGAHAVIYKTNTND